MKAFAKFLYWSRWVRKFLSIKSSWWSKKKNITRAIEHQQDSLKGKWQSSGAREHTLEYHSNFSWLHSKTIAREMSYRQRKIRQTQGIKKAKLTFELGWGKYCQLKHMETSLHKINWKWRRTETKPWHCWRQINFRKDLFKIY